MFCLLVAPSLSQRVAVRSSTITTTTTTTPINTNTSGVIVDTDTALFVGGFDIDDDLALLYLTAAQSNVLGITNTFGNDVSAKTHNDSLQLLARVPYQRARAYRGADVLAPHEPTAASEFMVDTLKSVARSGSKVTVLCIGAMSNLATALKENPELVDCIGQLVLLGGDLDAAHNGSLIPSVEAAANYYFDLESTAELFNLTRSVPTVVLAVQVLVQAAVTENVVERLGNCSAPAVVSSPDVHSRIAEWRVSHVARMNRTFGHLPGFAPGGFFPWDVHAATVAVSPDLYGDFGTFEVEVTADLRVLFHEVPAGTSNIVSPRKLKSSAFIDDLVERLCAV